MTQWSLKWHIISVSEQLVYKIHTILVLVVSIWYTILIHDLTYGSAQYAKSVQRRSRLFLFGLRAFYNIDEKSNKINFC